MTHDQAAALARYILAMLKDDGIGDCAERRLCDYILNDVAQLEANAYKRAADLVCDVVAHGLAPRILLAETPADSDAVKGLCDALIDLSDEIHALGDNQDQSRQQAAKEGR